MIKLTTPCVKCIHSKVCSFRDNAVHAMDKLKNTTYGKGPNNDYSWELMMGAKNVDITFSCPNFQEAVASVRR